MGIVIGIDEAGLGPNLGPFVVTAVVFEVADDPWNFNFWRTLGRHVTRDLKSTDGRVIVGDSKQLFQSQRGIGLLEQSVLACLGWAGCLAESARELRRWVGADMAAWDRVPWLQHNDLPLPCGYSSDVRPFNPKPLPPRVKLRQVRSRVIDSQTFNELLDEGNKSELVTRCHLTLLRDVCRDFPNEQILVQSDKHGGRNFYAGPLSALWDGEWIEILRESPQQSVYRCGTTEFRFQPKAEAIFPVAMASMVCKYLRELEMILMNRYWQGHLPGLAPTQGYPGDARRYLSAIQPAWEQLALPLSLLWRRK